MNDKKCAQVQQALADYRSDLLNANKCAELEAHIAECAQCAVELRTLDQVLELIEVGMEEIEPPKALWNGVYNSITNPVETSPGIVYAIRNWFAVPVRAIATGAAVIAVVAMAITNLPTQRVQPHQSYTKADDYVQAHAYYAAQAPLSDHAAYLSLVAASETGERN